MYSSATTTMAPVMYNQNQPTWPQQNQGQWMQAGVPWQTPVQAYSSAGYPAASIASPYSYTTASTMSASHVAPESGETAETQSTTTGKNVSEEEEPPPPPPGVEPTSSKLEPENGDEMGVVQSPTIEGSDKNKDHGILIQFTRDKNFTCALGLDASKKSVKFSDGILPGSKEAEQQALKADIRPISPAPPLPEGEAVTVAMQDADEDSNEPSTSEAASSSQVVPPPPASSPPPPPPPNSPPPPPPPATSAPVPAQTMQPEYQYAAQYANPMYYQQPYAVGYGYPPTGQPYDYAAYQQAYMYQQGASHMYYPVAPMGIPPQFPPPPGP